MARLLLLLVVGTLAAADPFGAASLVRGEVTPASAVPPGGRVEVAVTLRIAKDWHLYWSNPGDSGMPPRLTWRLPAGWTASAPAFPVPERRVDAGLVSFAYHDAATLVVAIDAPASAAIGEHAASLRVDYLVCQESCIPGTIDLPVAFRVGPAAEHHPAVVAAARQLPVPQAAAALTARARVLDGAVLVDLAGAGLTATGDTTPFLPADEGRFRLDTPQAEQITAGSWRLRLTLAAGATLPERLQGVLTGVEGVAGVAIDLPVEAPSAEPATSAGVTTLPTQAATGGLWAAIIAGVIGGLILNLMPCVLPVLALKALAISKARAAGRPLLGQALGYTAGVMSAFLALAVLLLALRAGGTQLGWGFQLQEPLVVLGLTGLFLLVAANLAGLFEVGLAATRVDAGGKGSFLNGVLTTVVATPCGAPFASAALGFAVVAPAGQAIAVFAAMGVGLAAPMLLLAAWPAAAGLLPRPGAWMEDLKRILAVPMLGAAGWMLWTASALVGSEGSFALLVAGVPALVLAAGAWGRFQGSGSRLALVVAIIALAMAVGAGWWAAGRGGPQPAAAVAGWQPWSPARERDLRTTKTPYLIDFTAAWCLTCQVNKRTTLHTAAVEAALAERGVVRLVADFTARDADITQALAARGRASVPTYVLSLGDREIVLPDLLTPGVITDAIAPLPRKIP
jgi:thiol:disulfide interchange protein/DsbC/DsbD-like thiol-disulfide interchange protein